MRIRYDKHSSWLLVQVATIISDPPVVYSKRNSMFLSVCIGYSHAGTAWLYWQWSGVLLVGTGFGVLALAAHFAYRKVHDRKNEVKTGVSVA